jgi:protoheme IX farnesyltransferase
VRDFLELTKPRITVLILVCTAVGYLFGCGSMFYLSNFAHVMLGTALMASGTSALNPWFESDSDARMHRTRQRPIPAGRMTGTHGFVFGVLLSSAGFAELWYGTNALAAALGLFTLLTYLFVYTPLKQRSPACTTVGAVPGAMPPLIGYAAASGGVDASALALSLILFVWQFPHFYAIAWMYREDYARGGIRMLPVMEPDGASTASRIVACSVLLIPISLVPRLLGMAGSLYASAALTAGLGLLYFGLRLAQARTLISARRVLLASVLYLPILFAAMLIDRTQTKDVPASLLFDVAEPM